MVSLFEKLPEPYQVVKEWGPFWRI